MFPITRPTPLLKLLGKTLLEHHVEKATASGTRQFTIVVNPKNHSAIEDVCNRLDGVSFEFITQEEQPPAEDEDIESAVWEAMKHPWHLFSTMERFLSGVGRSISPNASIHASATVEGDVVLEEGVQVMENAVVKGPCYVGKHSIIGTNALVRDNSHIGDRCIVGFSTEVKHSYIDDGCEFHQSYVGDSIIDERCSFGAGTITANVRFDGQNVHVRVGGERLNTGLDKLGVIMGSGCQTGVNAVIMPGVIVGPNSIIGPYVRLDRNLDANRSAFATGGYEITERS